MHNVSFCEITILVCYNLLLNTKIEDRIFVSVFNIRLNYDYILFYC